MKLVEKPSSHKYKGGFRNEKKKKEEDEGVEGGEMSQKSDTSFASGSEV